MDTIEPGSPRNDSLFDLYRRNWPALCEIMKNHQGLSDPYLPWVFADYEKADVKLVVVGKETNGWRESEKVLVLEPDQAISSLLKLYRDFELGTHYSGKRSFWVPVHELYKRLNPTGPKFGFVALNASKMDQQQRTPNDQVRGALMKTDLLQEELRILQPDVVVFFTGPRYESWLDEWFPDLKRTGDMWLSRLASAGLPKLSFRSYHPQYLNRRSKRSTVFDRILDAVTSTSISTH